MGSEVYRVCDASNTWCEWLAWINQDFAVTSVGLCHKLSVRCHQYNGIWRIAARNLNAHLIVPITRCRPHHACECMGIRSTSSLPGILVPCVCVSADKPLPLFEPNLRRRDFEDSPRAYTETKEYVAKMWLIHAVSFGQGSSECRFGNVSGTR